MLNLFPQVISSCYQRRMRRCGWRSRRAVSVAKAEHAFFPFKPLDQLREELKKEFNLTDEELDQQTMYLIES